MVYVSHEVRELDPSAVSAAIDGDPFFSSGWRPGLSRRHIKRACGQPLWHAWHACRVHHACRLMSAQEAPCESVGSQFNHIFSKRRLKVSIGSLVDRCLVREAKVHCVGGPRDERILDEVVAKLKEFGYSMPASPGHKVSLVPDTVTHSAGCR